MEFYCLEVFLIEELNNRDTGPTGATGPSGDTPSFAIGTVTTGAPGSDASVTITPV